MVYWHEGIIVNKKWALVWLLIFLMLPFGGLSQNTDNTQTQSQTSREVLNIVIVLSYDPILPWSQKVITGIAQAARDYPFTLNVFTESLFQGSQNTQTIENFVQGFALKYRDTHIDAIISDSVISDELFATLSSAPDFTHVYKLAFNAQKVEYKNVINTDVVSQYMNNTIKKNIDSMFELFPNTRHVYLNESLNNLIQPHLNALNEHQTTSGYEYTIHRLPFSSFNKLKSTLSQLPPDSIFLYLPLLKEVTKTNLTPVAALKQIAPYSNSPIFSSWMPFMGSGTIGGYILDPEIQGQTMLHAAISKILTGQFTDELPVGSWVYDEAQLNRFDLSVPERDNIKTIYHPHSSIFDDYPYETLSFFAVSALIIIFIFLIRQIRLNKALHKVKIANTASQKSAELAKRSSAAKSKFLANISHEIRTPINGMFGVLNILGKTTLNDEQVKLMQMGRYCTENLLRTVNDVLDLSKLESSQLQLFKIGFSPVQTFKESFAYAQLISESKPINVELDMTKLIDVPLLGDHIRIRQVIDNLINNAVKFTPNGSISITAYITTVSGLYQLHCHIKDTGEGIASDDAQKLFQPFVQIQDSYSKERSGTGLGLALCKELVELMDGDIQLKSEKDLGTEVHFYVTLPLADAIEPPHDSALPFALADIKDTKILLVEDNPINQEITQIQLEYFGIKCDIVEDGQQCLDHLQNSKTQYDVILMDIQMPIMDGYTAARSIRDGVAGAGVKSIPIIALTAHVSLEEQQKALLAGMNNHINKPIVPEKLILAIYDCIERSEHPML